MSHREIIEDTSIESADFVRGSQTWQDEEWSSDVAGRGFCCTISIKSTTSVKYLYKKKKTADRTAVLVKTVRVLRERAHTRD